MESEVYLKDEIQHIARLELELISSYENVLVEEHTANYRWLISSLLVVNSGGLFAVKDLLNGDRNFALCGGLMFLLGIALAMLAAWLGQRANRAVMALLMNLKHALMVAVVTGVYNTELVKDIQGKIQLKTMRSWAPAAFGFISFFAFAVGLIFLGASLPTSATAAPAIEAAHSK